jgi:hypothetical protein
MDSAIPNDSSMEVPRPNNRYFVIPPHSRDAIAWNPLDAEDVPIPDCLYIGRVLAAMEQSAPMRGLTFYITSSLTTLPSYGADVVAIHISDEWCMTPRYARNVRAIFKTYGDSLRVHWTALLRPTLYGLAALAQDLRTAVRRIPAVIAPKRAAFLGRGEKARVYAIPLGYYRQTEVPFVQIDRRIFDVYFAGSVANNSSKTSRASTRLTPKYISRKQMLDRVRKLATDNPQFAITTSLTASFSETTDDEFTSYSKAMMETKICLVPRGTSLETYRFFEGLRSGCVIICERLPHRWFYDGSPAISVRSWSELDRLIPTLLRDAAKLRECSEASLSWWAENCSERAVGAYIAERIYKDSMPLS